MDDLDDISKLEAYVESSAAVLVLLSAGYLQSRNCLRELRCAVERGKPLIVVRETELARGSMTEAEARDAFDEDDGAPAMPRRRPSRLCLCLACAAAHPTAALGSLGLSLAWLGW